MALLARGLADGKPLLVIASSVPDELSAGFLNQRKGKTLLGGKEARQRLEEIESKDSCRFTAGSYSLAGLGSVAEVVPEAFEFTADRQGLLPRGDALQRLMSRDLSAVLRVLMEQDTVRGGIVVDQGMLIDSVGELPADPDSLSAQIHTTLSDMRMEGLNAGLGLNGSSHWTLHTNDGSLLLAESGDISIGVWTEANTNHARLISAASGLLDGEMGSVGVRGGPLPEGFVLREGRGGPDAILSMLTAAVKEEVTGYLQAGQSAQAVSVLISSVYAHNLASGFFRRGNAQFTDSKWILKLHRLPVGSIVSRDSGTIDTFSLDMFHELLVVLRTRSESRRANLKIKLNDLFGFEIGMDVLRHRVIPVLRSRSRRVSAAKTSSPP